jgi:hypothetical protein
MSVPTPTTAVRVEIDRLLGLTEQARIDLAAIVARVPQHTLAAATLQLAEALRDVLLVARQEHYASTLHEQLARTLSAVLEERTELLAKIRELEQP